MIQEIVRGCRHYRLVEAVDMIQEMFKAADMCVYVGGGGQVDRGDEGQSQWGGGGARWTEVREVGMEPGEQKRVGGMEPDEQRNGRDRVLSLTQQMDPRHDHPLRSPLYRMAGSSCAPVPSPLLAPLALL